MYRTLANDNNIFDRLPFYLDENNFVDDFDEELTKPHDRETLNLNNTALSNLMPPEVISPSSLLRHVHIIPLAVKDALEGNRRSSYQMQGVSERIILDYWDIDVPALLSTVLTNAFINKHLLDTTVAGIVNFAGNREMDIYPMLVLVSEKYGYDPVPSSMENQICGLSDSQGIEMHRLLVSILTQLYRLASTGVILGHETAEPPTLTVERCCSNGSLSYFTTNSLVASIINSMPLSVLYYAYELVERHFAEALVDKECPPLFRERLTERQSERVAEILAAATEQELVLLRNLLVAFIVRRVSPFHRRSSFDRFYRTRVAGGEAQLAPLLEGLVAVEWDFLEHREREPGGAAGALGGLGLLVYQARALLAAVAARLP